MMYVRISYSLALQCEALIQVTNLSSVVVFNGMQFPEDTAGWVHQYGIRAIRHEVGLRPFRGLLHRRDPLPRRPRLQTDFQLNKLKINAWMTI